MLLLWAQIRFVVHENTPTPARQGRATARASSTGQAVRIGANYHFGQ